MNIEEGVNANLHVVGGEAMRLMASPVEEPIAQDARGVEGKIGRRVGGDTPHVCGRIKNLGSRVTSAISSPNTCYHDLVLLGFAVHHHTHRLEELDAQSGRQFAPAPREGIAHYHDVTFCGVVAQQPARGTHMEADLPRR